MKPKPNILELHRAWDLKGCEIDKLRLARKKLLQSEREGANDTGLQRWANSLGRLKPGKQLPF